MYSTITSQTHARLSRREFTKKLQAQYDVYYSTTNAVYQSSGKWRQIKIYEYISQLDKLIYFVCGFIQKMSSPALKKLNSTKFVHVNKNFSSFLRLFLCKKWHHLIRIYCKNSLTKTPSICQLIICTYHHVYGTLPKYLYI